MKLPISWLKDYIDLDGLSVEQIARKLTLAGLEVEEISYAGLPVHSSERHVDYKLIAGFQFREFNYGRAG